MALTTSPVLRQTQSLTLTPQMQQSLQVLQMSRAELEDFVAAELEANPLLQRADGGKLPSSLSTYELPVEQFGSSQQSLQEHVAEQINLSFRDVLQRRIAEALAATLDEAGYLHADLSEIAASCRTDTDQVAVVLERCQSFEPAGLFARDLAQCLRLQLLSDDRLTEPLSILLNHLPLVAKRDFATLKKLCNADDEELAGMLAEIRGLDPKPGLAFDYSPAITIVADLIVSKAQDGTWQIALNPQALPRILMNEDYSQRLKHQKIAADEKKFLRECHRKANWLTRMLDQRAQTIFNVGSEIIEQQREFLEHGAEALKPMTMQMVADAVNMHESTISRVARNKYMMTPQGLFELRYFFNAAIRGKGLQGDLASEAVRSKIRNLIAQETQDNILSDEAIMRLLGETGIEIARRTVAKYREELGIASSAKRKREQRLQSAAASNNRSGKV